VTPAPARLDNDTAREYLRFAGTLADAARNVTLSHFRSTSADLSIVNKSSDGQPFDPVTAADRGAEEIMRQMIRATYPNHGILGEEFEDHPAADSEAPPVTWVVDPIDGTKAFIAGIPTWGVLIGINDGSGAVAGIMDQPYTGERFVGGPDGATLNDRPLSTRSCDDLGQASLYCTDRGMFSRPSELAAFDAVSDQVALRRFGADCYAYCMLAHGLIDLVIEGDLKPFDIQALIPIVRGAGGVITNWHGGSPESGGLVVAAGDAARHKEVLEILTRTM
jgi:histidinol phosphatase-like enzyme (inositol monophosphatase family)